MKFDLHRAGTIGGTAIGAFVRTVEATTHRAARELCARDEIALPHREPTAKLEQALRSLERACGRKRTSSRRSVISSGLKSEAWSSAPSRRPARERGR